ncbi:dTMP kinase [Actinomadura violacea]|uniref:Thymidylate kinase n=1 Tax=Actinomadura violacea TaxID=2819934 RepID=A0ABS3RYC3_9ACTN|nr:hypothetical protein [Actinomadura violacea]MBO2461761.1 hypothetical protein [Actinomadura violacea]
MIVCVEGVNGCGKSTLAAILVDMWTRGQAVALDPVQHTRFGGALRSAIMAAESLGADAETLAFASARLHTATALAGQRCPPARELVVLERWAGAVVAYGTVAGSSPFLLRALEAALAGALPVDVTVLVDVPGEVAAARLTQQTSTQANRFETRGSAYLERVRRQYLAWASLRQVPVINGLQDLHTIAGHVTRLIETTAAVTDPGGGHTTKETA